MCMLQQVVPFCVHVVYVLIVIESENTLLSCQKSL